MKSQKQFPIVFTVTFVSLVLFSMLYFFEHSSFKEKVSIPPDNDKATHLTTTEDYHPKAFSLSGVTPLRNLVSSIHSVDSDDVNSSIESSANANSRVDIDCSEECNNTINANEYLSTLFAEPDYFIWLRAASPLNSSLIAHHAYMSGSAMSVDDSNEFFKNDPRYFFQVAIRVICPDCLLGLLYYEKNIAGGEVGIEQYEKILKSKELMSSLVVAAKSEDYFSLLFP